MADGKVIIDIEADASGFKSDIDGLDDEAKKAADGMEQLGDGAKKAADGMSAADVAMGTFIADGVTALISAVGDAISSLVGLADATREYREDMAKLETAFTTTGHSAETAKDVYTDMYKILGESDRSVEAANHLAELTDSEKELAQWSDIVAGVTAKFGDSLPIEGLTEAANETAKVGKVTGPLADALNWAGISEDEFNKKLEACNSEQERATLITETLNKEYKAAAEEYNELTASTQAAREATSNMEEAQANLGAAIEPVTTAWTNLKANALEAVLPLVEAVASKIQELGRWMEENPEKAEILKGALVGVGAAVAVLVAAFGGLMIVQTVSKAFSMLGLAMSGAFLPVTLIIAGIAALVAGFLYLWNNCEAFRNFFIALWENIKNIVADVAAWFKRTWDTAIAQLQTKWGSIKAFFTELWAEVKEIAAVAWAAITAVFTGAWELIKGVWDLVSPYYETVWETIKNIFSVVKAVLSGNFSDAWEAIRRIVDTWSGYFSQVWTLIKGVFAAVSSWFGEKFRGAYTAITNIWDSISGYFQGLYNDILGAFDGILDDFTSVGSNIINGIYNGIVAGWDWLVSTVKSLARRLFGAAKEELGIESPSKKFRWIGEMSMDGLSVGIEDNFPEVEKQMQGKMSDLTAHVQGVVAAESSQVGRSMGRPDNGFTELTQAIGMQTAGINSLSSEYRRGSSNNRPIILQLDKRELGRAIVNTGDVEKSRVGTKILTGGVYA